MHNALSILPSILRLVTSLSHSSPCLISYSYPVTSHDSKWCRRDWFGCKWSLRRASSDLGLLEYGFIGDNGLSTQLPSEI
ncbi:hypothetical protein CEXT_376861 [Caerostris extrusa]|uniref:Uncharacterized protein n=1 Tax=Caerostris extrusa TaxID=172846 RepID=A0AAV4MLR9_CAEEX|nr:hypothetical protein CEXT_376861 [Caerostris extrusa]